MLIPKVKDGTEYAMGQEECTFKPVRGCLDQVFAVRQVCNNYLENEKFVF